jgi:hypothetical protein
MTPGPKLRQQNCARHLAADRQVECYAIAENMDRERPQWAVLYGCYTRQFIAFPLFAMQQRVIVVAYYPDALTARMYDAERLWRIPEKEDE